MAVRHIGQGLGDGGSCERASRLLVADPAGAILRHSWVASQDFQVPSGAGGPLCRQMGCRWPSSIGGFLRGKQCGCATNIREWCCQAYAGGLGVYDFLVLPTRSMSSTATTRLRGYRHDKSYPSAFEPSAQTTADGND